MPRPARLRHAYLEWLLQRETGDSVEIHTRLGVLAARWPGSEPARRQRRVIQAAEAQFALNEAESGWRLLHALVSLDVPEAVQAADTHAPTTREEAWRSTPRDT